MKFYQVGEAAGEKGEGRWDGIQGFSDFLYPWNEGTPPGMSFKAFHTKDWLNCLFQVNSPNALVYQGDNKKMDVVWSDRVELFFKKDDTMSPYFGLEIDPLGRILDYEARYYRNFNYDWQWPSGQLKVNAGQNHWGYEVEIFIGLNSLRDLGLLKENKLEVGVFRGECLDLLKTETSLRWISWVRPDAPEPDFHIPSSFGIFKLD